MRLADAFRTTFNVALIVAVVVYAVIAGDGGVALDEGSVGRQVRDTLWVAAVCGIAAFATIEVLKRIFGIRGIYQQRQVERWLEQRTPPPGRSDQDTDAEPEAPGGSVAFEGLLDAMGLSSPQSENEKPDPERDGAVFDRDVRRVFNLPSEHLAAQVGAAADLVLSSPQATSPLLDALAGRSLPPSKLEDDALATAQRVRAGVDQLQISLGDRWRQYVQSAAVWVSGLYGILLVEAAPAHERGEARYIFAALLVGGAVAWVVRDIAAVIERARQ